MNGDACRHVDCALGGWSSQQKQENDVNNIHELNINELDTVSGGVGNDQIATVGILGYTIVVAQVGDHCAVGQVIHGSEKSPIATTCPA